MSLRRSSLVCLLTATVFSSALALASDPARFVPRDAVVYVQAPSIEKLDAGVRALLEAVDPDQAEAFDFRELLLSTFGGEVSPDLVDASKPVALAVTISPSTMQPVATFILPTASRDALVQALSAHHTSSPIESDGDYVAYHTAKLAAPALAAEANPFAQGLRPGVVSARVDLEKLIEIYRPMIEMGLEQLEQMASALSVNAPAQPVDMESVMAFYMEGIQALLDSAERLEVACDHRGSRAELTQWLTVADGSAMDGWGSKEPSSVGRAAAWLDPDASIAMAVGADFAKLYERMKPMIGSLVGMYDEPMRTLMVANLAQADSFMQATGTALAASGDIHPTGMRFTYYVDATDAQALLAAYLRSMAMPQLREQGIEFVGPTDREIGGLPVKQGRMSFSPEAMEKFAGGAMSEQMRETFARMYGTDGLAITLAAKDKTVAFTVGGDDAYVAAAIARLSASSSKAPPALADTLASVAGQQPCLVARFDVGKLAGSFLAIAGESNAAAAASLPPLALTMRFGIADRQWISGLACDLGELGRFVRAAESIDGSELEQDDATDGESPDGKAGEEDGEQR